MKDEANYYVYAYFDPRNFQMLYVGKGKGSRKFAHKPVKTGTEKERILHEIRRQGLKPLIRVIAANLTNDQALLVEKALIWRPGDALANISSGHYADNFRPANTLHKSLPGFDTTRGVYFVNVGQFSHREWDDCRKYRFLAAGYGRQYSSQLDRLEVGSIVAAYMKGNGYVGIARVLEKAVPIRHFRCEGRPLTAGMLHGPELLHDANDLDECEYLVKVRWLKHLAQKDARFRHNAGLFANQSVVASLSNQQTTLAYLEQEFNVDFEKILEKD